MAPTNRLTQKFNQTQIESFATFSAFTGAPTFKGPDLQALVNIAKQQSFKQGFDVGVNSAFKHIDKKIREKLDDYILLNTRIVDFAKKEIEDRFKSKNDFKLIEARANFYKFIEGSVSILFIIEANIENQLWFSALLSGLERKVFEEDRFIADLIYINQKDKGLDKNLINCDYPFDRIFKH